MGWHCWVLATVTALTALGGTALGQDDDTIGPGEATSLCPRKGTNIALVRQLVEVTLTTNEAHFRETYWLKNTANARETLRVGFYPGGQAVSPRTVKVDGARQRHARNPSRYGDDPLAGFQVWDMDFELGQERVVTLEYDSQTTFRDTAGRLTASNRQLTYCLSYSADWKGLVGELVVKVKLADEKAREIWEINPPGASWAGDTITWKRTQFEPSTQDAVFLFYVTTLYKELGIEPGIEGILSVLKDRSNPEWQRVANLARDIGVLECFEVMIAALQSSQRDQR